MSIEITRMSHLILNPSILFCVAARGFGMRVVGGKTGNDGRTFACIVWTVPGGPAEKAGLQQGDKVRVQINDNDRASKLIVVVVGFTRHASAILILKRTKVSCILIIHVLVLCT